MLKEHIQKSRKHTDLLFLLLLQGLNYLMPIFVIPYLIATLGSHSWGYIGFSLSVVQYMMLVVDFGFNMTATKRVSLCQNDEAELQKVIWETLWAKILLLILCFVAMLVVAFAIEPFRVYSTTLMIMFLMVVANTFSFVWLFQGLGKIKVASLVNTVVKITILPLVFFLVKSPEDYPKAAWVQAVVYMLSSVVVVALIMKNGWIKTFLRPTWSRIRFSLKDSFPIFLTVAATSIYTALFVVVLGFVSTPDVVGEYSAAEKVMRGIAYLVFVPVSQYMFPKVSVLASKDSLAAKRLVRKVALAAFVMTLLPSLMMFFGADLIVKLFGSDYHASTGIYRIMAFIPVFIVVGGIFGQLGLVAAGDEVSKKHFQWVYFFVAGVGILLIFTIIPIFKLQGTAWGLFITELLVLLGMMYYNKKEEARR